MPPRVISIQYLMGLVLVAAILLAAFQTGDTSVGYVVLLVGLMTPWVVVPINLHRTHWVETAVDYEPFELNTPALPLVVVNQLQQTEPTLCALGFQLRGRFGRRAGSGPTKVAGYIALFEDPTTYAQARVIASIAPKLVSLTLVFRTEYTDGTHFSTSNSTFPGVLPSARSRPGSMAFPQVRDTRLLHEIHNLRAVPLGRVEVGIDDPIARLVHDGRLERLAWIDGGYYHPEAGTTRLRLTWKGAVLMSWKFLKPVPQFRRAWRRWRAARTLRDMGVGGAM